MYEIIPKNILQQAAPDDDYYRLAWQFCSDWASGQTHFLRHTSGSTGTPKPISLTRAQMQASAQLTQKAVGLQAHQTALVCLNVAYIAGTMMLVRGMEIGMPMIIVEPSNQPLKNITEKVDFMAVVPLQIQNMLTEGLHQKLNEMKAILVGGAALSPALLTQIRALTVPVYSTYGMTETVSHIALQRLNGAAASAYYQLLDGIETAVDERGCLKIRGEICNNEWVQTNDVVNFATDSSFVIIGRADNIINSGGVKIQLEKIENEIDKIGLPQRFFCWGVADETLGQRLVCVIEGEIDQSLGGMIEEKIKTKLSRYELPKAYIFVEKLAETPTGKIDKRATIKTSQSVILCHQNDD